MVADEGAALLEAIVRQAEAPPITTQRFSYVHEKEKPFTGHGNNSPVVRPRGEELVFYAEPHIEVPAMLRQCFEVTQKMPGRYYVRPDHLLGFRWG